MKKLVAVALAVACMPCIDWTRLSGTVKSINLKSSTVTIQNRDGDLLTIPVDYQVSIAEKHGENRTLKTLKLDEKVTLIRVPAEAPRDDSEGLTPPPPESSAHGAQ